MKVETSAVRTDVFKIKFATNQTPEYSINKSAGIINQGKKNDYPDYTLFLFDNHAEHGAIVRGKADYVTGLNIKPVDENQTAIDFLKRANSFETWQDLRKKYNLDRAKDGGYFLKIESNAAGVPINWYHLPYNSVRVSDDFESFKVCDDWKRWRNNSDDFPKFKPGTAGTSIYYFKEYSPSKDKVQGVYSKPEYLSCTLDIDTDIRLGTFSNNFIKNNFSSGTLIVIPNGETDQAKKDVIANNIKGNHTGEDNAGNAVIVFAPKEGVKDVQVLSLNANDLANQHSEVRKTNKEKIVAGHRVNGALFKIKMDDKSLLSREELAEQHELFINEYVKVKQEDDLKEIEKWFRLSKGIEQKFEVDQIELIGLDLPLENQNVIDALNTKNPQIFVDYVIKKFGIKVPETLGANGIPIATPVQESAKPNDFLKGLSAKENMDLIRIVRDFDKERLNEAMAMARIRAYGIDDVTAKQILGIDDVAKAEVVKQSSQGKNKKIEDLFLKYSHDIQEGEVLEIIDFKKMNFETALTGRVNELRNGILNQLKGNPYLTEEELAKQLGVEQEYVTAQIKWLNEKGLIELGEGTFQPSEKAMGKETEPFETEIITEYTYQKRPDISGPILLPTSRPDCVKWVNLTRSKAITYEAIQNLTNDFGEPAWDFAGGFYNDNGEITPWCRHYWEGQTKIVIKK